MRRCTSPPFFVPPTRYKDKTLHDGEMKTQVGERRLYLKDSENKCSVLFPYRASFGMIHDAPMWRIAAILFFGTWRRTANKGSICRFSKNMR